MPTSRLTRWILGTVIFAVLIGIGFFAGYVTPGLRNPGNDSPEAGFARDMSTHHGQAVAMAMLEVQNGSDPQVRALAADIALTQQGQIGEMQTWLTNWNLEPTGDQPEMAWMPGPKIVLVNGLMPGMASEAEMNALSAAKGAAADDLFCQLMLRHHEGGIHMVEGILQVTKNKQVETLANDMLTGQQAEIGTLTQDLARLGVQPLSS
jgi:uncharacterized protein (DUF305 family)